MFEIYLKSGVFPKKLKMIRVIPFKCRYPKWNINYRLVSVLLIFLRFYYALCQYVNNEKTLYTKQFGFHAGDWTEYKKVKLAEQTHDSFEKNATRKCVAIDLSNAFDVANHPILLKMFEKVVLESRLSHSSKIRTRYYKQQVLILSY